MIHEKKYTLSYLAEHLYEAGQYDRLYYLLLHDKWWMEAKLLGLGSDEGYNADLDLARRTFTDPLSPHNLCTLIQLHTATHTIYQRGEAYSDDALITLVELGREAEAIGHARLRVRAEERCYSLLAVYRALIEQRKPRHELLVEAQTAAYAIGADQRAQIYALCSLGAGHAQAGNQAQAHQAFSDAVKVFNAISRDNILYIWSLQQFAVTLAMAGRIEKAREATALIYDDFMRAIALSDMLPYLIPAELAPIATIVINEVQQLIRKLTDIHQRSTVLARVIASLSKIEEPQRAQVFLDEFDQLLASSPDDFLHMRYAVALSEMKQFDAAVAELSRIETPEYRWEAQGVLAKALSESSHLTWALNIADSITDGARRAQALNCVARGFVRVGRSDEAWSSFQAGITSAQVVTETSRRSNALNAIVLALIKTTQLELARQVTQHISDNNQRGHLLRQIEQPYGAEDGIINGSLPGKQVREVDSDVSEGLASGHTNEAISQFEEAINRIQQNENGRERIIGFSTIAVQMMQAGKAEQAEQFFQASLRIYQSMEMDNLSREVLLRELTPLLTHGQRFVAALSLLETQRLDLFIRIVATWVSSFEEYASGSSVNILRQMLRIASWVRSDWQTIYAVVAQTQ